MPSGAKKRKAAKKKKENQNQSNNHSDSAHGDEGVKHQDDRESNAGELSSPTSPDHEKLPVEAEVEGASSMEGSRIDNVEERVGVEKEIKIEDESGVKDGIINHNEANRKPYDGGLSGSSSSSTSSDDESRGIKKGEPGSSIPSGVSVETDDSLSRKSVEPVCDSLTAEAGDSIVESISAAIESEAAVSVAPHVVESTLEENGEKKFGSVEDRICTSVEEADVGSAESTPKNLDAKECVAQENDDRSTSPSVALDNGARRVKDSVVTQPVVSPSPYPVQKTSWKSCCGLLEMFSGSGH